MNKSRILLSQLAVFMLSTPITAYAWESLECGSNIYGGVHSAVTFSVDRCDTPANSTEDEIIDYGMAAWNSIVGAFDRFSSTDGDNNCVITSADGRWEIGIVPATDPLLDGNAGLASIWVPVDSNGDPICTNNGRATGASVVVDQTLPLGPLDELDTRLGARETLIHELGHVLGALHEEDVISVMCTSTFGSCGKVGRRSGDSSSSLGNRSETQLPDDTAFATTYHASTNAGNTDLVTSPWRMTSNGPRLNHTGSPRVLCPGATTSVRFSFGNMGKVNVPSFNPADISIVMSTNDYISVADTEVTTGTVWGASGSFGTFTWNFTVPSLSPNTYHVGVMVDTDKDFVEDDEFNNASETGLQIRIPSGC